MWYTTGSYGDYHGGSQKSAEFDLLPLLTHLLAVQLEPQFGSHMEVELAAYGWKQCRLDESCDQLLLLLL